MALLAGYVPLILIWLFAVGACFGSFINVVVYRLPAGQSLLYPPSRCPVCGKPIRARHNVPILGWLILGGRCRDCRAPIAARYPLVELATGLIFALLAWMGPLQAGSLPVETDGLHAAGLLSWFVYAYHLLLACSLLSAALIDADGHRLSATLVTVVLLAGFVPPLFEPAIRPVPSGVFQLRYLETFGSPRLEGLVAGLVGLLAGALVGWLLPRGLFRLAATSAEPAVSAATHNAMAVLLWAGVFTGWQAVVGLSIAGLAVAWPLASGARRRPLLRRIRWPAILLLFTLVWIVASGHLGAASL